ECTGETDGEHQRTDCKEPEKTGLGRSEELYARKGRSQPNEPRVACRRPARLEREGGCDQTGERDHGSRLRLAADEDCGDDCAEETSADRARPRFVRPE